MPKHKAKKGAKKTMAHIRLVTKKSARAAKAQDDTTLDTLVRFITESFQMITEFLFLKNGGAL